MTVAAHSPHRPPGAGHDASTGGGHLPRQAAPSSTGGRGNSVRILLAGPQSPFCDAMRAALQQNPGLAVIGEARNRAEAAAEAARTRPDVVLFDADLPSEDLADSCALIGERSSSTKVLVLAGEESLATIIEALEGGASGYLTKESPAKDLIEATEPVSRGETWIPSHLLGALVARLFRPWREEGEALERMPHLTPRERQVLALLANGEDNRTIDRRMAISPETARTHTQNILRKLEVHTRLEAAMFVRQNVPRTRPPCGEGVACPI